MVGTSNFSRFLTWPLIKLVFQWMPPTLRSSYDTSALSPAQSSRTLCRGRYAAPRAPGNRRSVRSDIPSRGLAPQRSEKVGGFRGWSDPFGSHDGPWVTEKSRNRFLGQDQNDRCDLLCNRKSLEVRSNETWGGQQPQSSTRAIQHFPNKWGGKMGQRWRFSQSHTDIYIYILFIYIYLYLSIYLYIYMCVCAYILLLLSYNIVRISKEVSVLSPSFTTLQLFNSSQRACGAFAQLLSRVFTGISPLPDLTVRIVTALASTILQASKNQGPTFFHGRKVSGIRCSKVNNGEYWWLMMVSNIGL